MDTKTYTKFIAEDKSEHDKVEDAEARNEWLLFRKIYKERSPGVFLGIQSPDFISVLRCEFSNLREAFKKFEEEHQGGISETSNN